MIGGLGGWVAALIIGLICYLVAPHVPPPASTILRIIGIVLLVVALVLFLIWIVGLLTGSGGVAALALL